MSAGDDDLPSLDDWGEELWGVPPPPPPPSLGSVCSSGAPFYCELEGGPMGAHFDRAQFPSLPIVAVCSSVVFVAVLVASFLLWRHKSKVQNLLPCKNEQPGHLGELGAANGVTYEDVLINHHPTRLPQPHQTLMPLEILDVKLGDIGPPQITTLHHTTFYPPNRDPSGQVVKSPFHHPVYEEVAQAPPLPDTATRKSYGESDFDESSGGKIGGRRSARKSYESDFDESGGGKLGGRSSLTTSDDDDEEYPSREGSGQCSATSSVRGSTGGDLCRDPVSSDEGGNSEDCDFMIDGGSSFDYPRKHLHVHSTNTTSSVRPEKLQQRPLQHHNHVTTYPERTVNVVMPPPQRIEGNNPPPPHSTSLTDCHNKKHLSSSSHVPSPSFVAPIHCSPTHAQWPMNNHGHYPTGGGPSQENIYSTIDEDELPMDYHHHHPVHPSLTSLGSPVVPKSTVVRGGGDGRAALSQRTHAADDNGSSYGDIMPAFNSASFT